MSLGAIRATGSAYFREDYIAGLSPGDRAIVTLMSHPDKPLEGRVESHGWGVSQDDGSTGNDLLPSISATFEWIRLAQRVPVLVHLLEVPDDVKLIVGTTASVVVMTGTPAEERKEPFPAVPRALQQSQGAPSPAAWIICLWVVFSKRTSKHPPQSDWRYAHSFSSRRSESQR